MAVTFLTNEDEKRFVKSINNVQPDENGNVKIAIENSDVDVDLTGYATEEWVQASYQPKGDYLTEVPEGYAKSEDIPYVPTVVSAFKNDAGYLTQHQDLSDYAKIKDIPTKPEDIGAQPAGEYLTEVPNGYATEEFVKNKIAEAALEGNDVDLSGYAKKSEIPTKVSQLANDKGYLTEHQSLAGYAKSEDIPTKPEDIGAQPAGNYALKTEIPSVPVQSVNGKTGEVVLSASDVGALPNTTKIPSNISELTNDSGYLTEHQDISGKLDANKLPEAINIALAQAKDSGEFDGYTPIKNVDYFDGKDYVLTEDDKNEIAEIAADLVDVPDYENNSDEVYILSENETLSDVPDGITVVIDPDGNPDFDLSKYVKISELDSAIDTALINAKNSGEFDGEDGYTPVKGVDYFDGKDYVLTESDKTEIAEMAADRIDVPEITGGGYVAQDTPPEDTSVLWLDLTDNSDDGFQEAVNEALAHAKSTGMFDGKTPVKGTDYYTEAEKNEIVNAVLSALPTWTGGSF